MPAQNYDREKNGIRLDLLGGMNTMLPTDLIQQAYSYLQNVRRNLAGRAVARPTLTAPVLASPLGAPATSMIRLNDPYLAVPPGYAPGYVYILGAAGVLYVANSVIVTSVASGFSGLPLSFVTVRPNASPQPWCYVADYMPNWAVTIPAHTGPPAFPAYPAAIYGNNISGMVKVRSDGVVFHMGIAEPQVPPTMTLTQGQGPNWTIYRYIFRSTITGALSNPSPESPAQVAAQGTDGPNTVQAQTLPTTNYNNSQYDPTAGPYLRTSGSVGDGVLTDYIVVTGFGLSVPPNVPVQGIQVTMNWYGQSGGTGLLVNVSLYYQGSQFGVAKSPGISNTQWPTTPATPVPFTMVGSNTDTWGGVLSPEIINDATFGFGVQIEAVGVSGTNRSFIDSFELQVFWANQNSTVTATISPDPQVDKIDFYRNTSALLNFTYVGTIQNTTAAAAAGLIDTLSDLAVAGNPILQFDNFEPFPSIDLPHSGVCTVTAVNQQVSGVQIVFQGSGQTDGTFNISSVGGGGTGAVVRIVILGGIITTATVTAAGANYTSDPAFPVPITGTPGSLAASISPVLPVPPNVTWTSGDQFNVRWLPGNIILLGSGQQNAWTLYARPTSATTMLVYQSIIDPTTGIPTFNYPAAGTGITYSISEAALAAQPSPVIWGPTPESQNSQAGFYFGLDPLNPGDLLWCKGNNFDSAPDTNRVQVTSPSEVLMNGVVTSEINAVFSTDRFWLIYPNFADAIATVTGIAGNQWTLIQAKATRGLYMRYAIAALGSTIAYRAKDCIALSQGGGEEQSLTDSIYNLFPHGGSTPQPVTIGGNTVYPPDDTKPQAQTITLTTSYIFYDYQDASGIARTLVYDINAKGWSVDVYSPTVNCHLFAVGSPAQLLVGCTDSTVRQFGAGAEVGSTAVIQTHSENAGEARALKRIGDVFIKGEIQGTTPVALQLWNYQFTVQMSGFLPLNLTGSGSVAYYTVDFVTGFGSDVVDIGAVFTWPVNSTNVLDLWQPDWTNLPETIQDRPSDWTECGVPGNKLIRGMIVEMDTFNATKTIRVQRSDDEMVLDPDQVPVTANGQTLVPFTFATPFTAHMLRLVSNDGVPWRLFGAEAIQWICDPWPDYTPLRSAWNNLGSDGAKYLRSILIPMDTNSAAATFTVLSSDGASINFSATTTTAQKTPVPFAFLPPVVVHEVQLQCQSNAALWTEEVRWFADPYPELIPAYTPIMEVSGPDNKFVQGIKIVADTANNFVGDTNGQPVSFQVLYDGGQVGPVLGPSVFNGKMTRVYSFAAPFNAHDLQLMPLNPVRIWMPGMGAEDTSEWVFQPAPESATTWTTEGSSLGLLGWNYIYQINLAYISANPVTLTVNTDQGPFTLTYPPSTTSGPDMPAKVLLKCPRNKWKVVSFSATSSAAFSLWKDLTEVWIRSWGETTEFHKVNPFGGDSSPAATI